VIEQPSDGLGAINDMWFQWVIDMGKPGPDRFIAHSRTNTMLYALRAFIADGKDPKPTVENIRRKSEYLPLRAGQLRLLREDQRERAERARAQLGHGARRHRHRPRQGARPGRADEEESDRRVGVDPTPLCYILPG